MTSAHDENCCTVVDLVTDYLEDALPTRRRTTFETHVVYCPGCAPFVAQMRNVVEQLRGLPPDRLDRAEREELLAGLGGAA
jgi:anti-sigma factor RsiW